MFYAIIVLGTNDMTQTKNIVLHANFLMYSLFQKLMSFSGVNTWGSIIMLLIQNLHEIGDIECTNTRDWSARYALNLKWKIQFTTIILSLALYESAYYSSTLKEET